MSYPARVNLNILQGATFTDVRRWGITPFLFKPISAITRTAPVELTVLGHGVPNGWFVAVSNVRGMVEINAAEDPPAASDFMQAVAVDGDTLRLDAVNAVDFTAYSGGGLIRYATPVDLHGYTARMQFRADINDYDAEPLVSLTTENDGIIIDPDAHIILVTMTASETADLDLEAWENAVYDLELVSGSVVTRLMSGTAKVSPEVTR